MIERTLEQVQSLISPQLAGETQSSAQSRYNQIRIAGVSTDTRTIQSSNLFIPLVGEHFDGHDYASDAYNRGAAAVLWQIDHPSPPKGVPIILVLDTLLALQQLAKAYRQELPVRVIGITGSNGKTTTKDLVASVLSTTYHVHKTKGNLNNHIGLPLTLLQLDENTEFAVIEMGMSNRGEIALLSELAEPEAAIITMIGEAHLLQLGSRKEIARAKVEILEGLQVGGTLIYNGDEPIIEEVLLELHKAASFKRLRFGKSETNDVYPTQVKLDSEGTHFQVNKTEYPDFYIPLLGFHNVINALAAIEAAALFDVKPEQIQSGLAASQLTSMRIEKLKAPFGLTVLNDAYNASPASMKAALELTEQLSGYGRRFAVLGDMLELGSDEEQFHRDIGKLLSPGAFDTVFTFGRLAAFIAEEAAQAFPQGKVKAFQDKQELIQQLQALISKDDVVLIKGSRGMRLEQVANALLS
ncbi:UDP-N-acetylmuramoyl-tripeptide--D-alanyl-D-alanine ligase [Paenibacillus sp. GP183]|jgi:UDP-N-acetylmuramoyl-tripeptide--D-alanyl-D-alanine ligase|uniref:UDP-N-acetylmuramoyl-tripeptide--D-alanyl-D- alanine ligase n=1 Tax=Paenibacillus sp. GP183 TaxID=1882751 RepID=UPI000895CCBC|nr:UDP-N-acetylmuramoyl-tripeptide--D-alanyl-D-alanine ligase [Paenibacillus sp. GP183]SEB41799.1 UDP-N-acetylmuramoyl-tripeptide--D-alanyl-D-alanine ligase [Paenibacillus sp. GP183]